MRFLSPPIWAALRNVARGTASRLMCLAALAAPAVAGERVSTELVLAVDVSLSVNDIEYALQTRGMADAFRDPDVIALIASMPHGLAVLVTQWTGTFEASEPLPWRVLRDEADVLAYATALAAAPRMEFGNYTGLGNAIAYAVQAIESNAYVGDEMKIDVSGDGRSNSGPEPRDTRLLAAASGITINGLAIIDNDRALKDYYTNNVITGPGAFAIAANDFEAFGEAFRRKLKRELSPKTAALE
jgi:Ca-activated chloride channel homolog